MNAKRWIALVIALGVFALSAVMSLLLAVFDTMGNDGKMQFGLNDTQEETVLEQGNRLKKNRRS